ncbi:MAG TPA: ABC transporter ATP-binding protein [Gemmatales bacterium]|nr:ABC transporter ATP-binding protein [Gemmatales bacterium]
MSNCPNCSPPMLETRELWKSYPDGSVDALRGVSLKIQPGEYLAIMGPSGSGKSTLLNMLGALDKPTSGKLLFQNQPYPQGSSLDTFRAQHLGFVFQSFCLIPTLTAWENVQVPMLGMVGGASERKMRARDLLTLVGLEHRLRHVPAKLSVGERQRVAIARALANRPRLLLADEPTGNLDSQRTEEILNLFDTLRQQQDITLVVVTHSRQVAERAERILEFRDGVIAREDWHTSSLKLVA